MHHEHQTHHRSLGSVGSSGGKRFFRGCEDQLPHRRRFRRALRSRRGHHQQLDEERPRRSGSQPGFGRRHRQPEHGERGRSSGLHRHQLQRAPVPQGHRQLHGARLRRPQGHRRTVHEPQSGRRHEEVRHQFAGRDQGQALCRRRRGLVRLQRVRQPLHHRRHEVPR